jgi:hypothetical protein
MKDKYSESIVKAVALTHKPRRPLVRQPAPLTQVGVPEERYRPTGRRQDGCDKASTELSKEAVWLADVHRHALDKQIGDGVSVPQAPWLERMLWPLYWGNKRLSPTSPAQ